MSNATDIVKYGVVRRTDEFITKGFETLAAETRLWPNAMLGVDITGYLCKLDDTQGAHFFGLVSQELGAPLLPISTAGDGTAKHRAHQPFRFELPISGIAVTDFGKLVYALFDNQGTLDPSATTYSNLIGHVVGVVASGVALVEPCYDAKAANRRLGAAKWLAATGAQSLNKTDLNKTIFAPNTAGLTLTLPAIADTQAGDFLRIVKTSSDAAAVTLDGNASETIDGSTTLATLDAQFDCALLVSTGAAWVVGSRDVA